MFALPRPLLALGFLCVFAPLSAGAQTAAVPAAFAPVAFLVGDWTGDGTSDAGSGSGTDSWKLEVQGQLLVRRSHAVYPPKDGKPGLTYESAMYVYSDPAYPQLRADYIDGGGHVIHYTLVPSPDAQLVQFVSDPIPSAPRFRLTYRLRSGGSQLAVKFEMAPPGSSTFSVPIADGIDSRVVAK
jgi:hypothetical protein